MALRIEDYALIGDCETAALVGKNGSIDWLCLPQFDSPACFAALLGGPEHGHWQIAPANHRNAAKRRYRPDTLVLDTEFECESGRCRLTDFMPSRGGQGVARIVTGLEGHVDLKMELVIRFDYGRITPWVSREGDALVAIAGPDRLVLRTPASHRGEDFKTVAGFTISAGKSLPFTLSYGPSHIALPEPFDAWAALKETEEFWSEWSARCKYSGPWREPVVRSLITLKALTYHPTGGIVAAPTASLPECPGGSRNWDYRYCWLRDATFTLLVLMHAGYRDEAEVWRAWLVRSVAGLPSQLQPVYSVMGHRYLAERELSWLPGYGGATPVHAGNDAYGQLQIDTFGEVLDALHHARCHDLGTSFATWSLQKSLLEHLEILRDLPDRGIWEFRGPELHFTYSKVMTWVAFDRAIAAVTHFGLDGPLDHWRRLRDKIHTEICEKAFNAELGAFVQSYGSKQLDAATLLLPLVGFLPAHDPRMIGTVAAIKTHLMQDDCFFRRYESREAENGLPAGEGAFLACSFWYADNRILQGNADDGRRIFERLLDIRNETGLLPEQFDPHARRFLGNFPQALTHLSLVNTAYNLHTGDGPARQRASSNASRHA